MEIEIKRRKINRDGQYSCPDYLDPVPMQSLEPSTGRDAVTARHGMLWDRCYNKHPT